VRRELSRVAALDASAKYDLALEAARGALAHAEAVGWDPLVADARRWVAGALLRKGQLPEAEREFEEALFVAGRAGSLETAALVADSLVLVVGQRQARHADGLRWSRIAEVLHPDVEGIALARHLQHVATVHHAKGEHSRAIELYERVLDIDERTLGAEHPSVALVLSNLAVARQSAGDHARAREELERALAIRERVLGPEHPDVASALSNMANVSRDLGDLAGARELHRRALAIRERTHGPESADVAMSLNNLGNAVRDGGDPAEAGRLFARSLAIFEARLGPDHPHVGITALNLGFVRADAGDDGGAREAFERALAVFERKLGPEHANVAAPLVGLAGLELRARKFAEARGLAERALRLREKAESPPMDRAETQFLLARTLVAESAQRPRAVELAKAALAVYVAEGEAGAKQRAEIEAFLHEHGG
jgi:tetratricopeptide (TPR) repeat protein